MDGMSDLSREEAFALLKKYNQDPFHIHATVSSQSDKMSTRKVVPSGTRLSTLICAFHLFTMSLT